VGRVKFFPKPTGAEIDTLFFIDTAKMGLCPLQTKLRSEGHSFYKFRIDSSDGLKKSLRDISNILTIESVDRRRFLMFDFQEFQFFWNSENGGAMFLGNSGLLKPLIAIPYMLLAEIYNTRRKRYFVKLGDYTAAIFVLLARGDTLRVSALAVSPDHRRRGVGLFILEWAEKLCKQMKIKWLQLSVLKSNTPAQRLYQKFGLKLFAKGRFALKLRKRIQV